ncbi:probable ubiquitin carboxyl-terminal hydrolase MINDY-4 [Trichonephila clavata]|uniref:Ubiquitin carboxyl-terminal hydrolase MINDY n=1 Tax=Trichonephila clavata TaxID=2740835 RepID=A0A8X6FAB5_TRICU|nr:probable ubiquitin carboxyl-terminal hydrolase MINDY-4 [Trichonephila clavata]
MQFNKMNGSTISCDVLSSFMAEKRPITIDEACALRLLLFGNTMNSFGVAWTEQSFHFRCVPPYGFIQKRAGPCGVLAAVQAFVIYELLFGVSCIDAKLGISKLKSREKKEALARALTYILWQAGDDERAVVAIKHNDIVFDASTATNILEFDGIIEYNISTIIYLKIKQEMDDPGSHLIGGDGYCSQEVINLILIGKAVPNLFDGDLELNSGGSETTLLRGIPKQSKIGLLSLYEYQETCTVGDNYKNPIYPIWILLAESHFTVLFAVSKDIFKKRKSKDTFVLYHYDGLAKQHAETIYAINPAANTSPPPKDKTLPIAIRCIYTRWPYASVETNEKEVNEDQTEASGV